MVKLQQPLNVTLAGESGIDAGALKAEFFTKVFEIARRELFENPEMLWCEMPKPSGGNLQIFKIFGVILAHSLLQEGSYFNYLAPWVVEVLLNEKDISVNVPLSHIPVTTPTRNIINFVKSLNECDTEKSINDLFDTGDGPAFEQIINSSDWDADEPVTSSNKAILENMLLYEETVVRRGKKVEAIREGLKAMSFTRYFGKDATKSYLGGKPEVFYCRRMLDLVKWKESDDSKIT